MKLMCKTCGCHFPDQFEETIDVECNYWHSRGFPDDFPVKYLKQIWDALCSIPYDEIAVETGIIVSASEAKVSQGPRYEGNQWEQIIPEYKDWHDEKRKRFQKAWFKEYYNPTKGRDLPARAVTIFADEWNDPNAPEDGD